ncbi:MAG TPA: hypothetical protein VFS67_14145 [Polyangiaceae bacterium]|nr:hypothetical protein [Polyangiaceae bacterium]
MKSIEFYDLPRPVQERFVAASQASLAPAPLALRPASKYVGARWFGAALVGLCVTSLFALNGFGDLEHPAALATGLHALIYCLGFTLSFASLTRGLTLRDRALSLPFARGTYLFPMGVVEAQSSALNVHSLTDLRTVEATASALNVTFVDGASFDFPAADQAQAEAAKRAVTESQERLDEATRADSVRGLAALDPLLRTNFPSPFSHDVPFQRPTSMWAFALLAMAVVSGAALGVGVWEVRNKLSARRLAETARALDTTSAYRQYLARGGHSPEIIEVLLPRAELAEAKAQGTVRAIEDYIASHPGSKIQDEEAAALRAALLAALERAQQPGTLAALEAFQVENPRYAPIARELADARHKVYRAAADRAKQLAVATGARRGDPAAFLESLVAHAEQHGPPVEIRFRSALGRSAKTADNTVRAGSFFAGNASLPSRYFGEAQMQQREALAGPLLVSALQSLFSKEILEFKLGAPLPGAGEDEKLPPLPEPSVPTLYVDYKIELSGAVVNQKPRGMYFGAGMFFDTDFRIPDSDARLQMLVRTWRSPSRNVMRAKEGTTGIVYEDVGRRSLNLFLRRYLKRILRDPPELSVPAVSLPDADQDDKAKDEKDSDEREDKDDDSRASAL